METIAVYLSLFFYRMNEIKNKQKKKKKEFSFAKYFTYRNKKIINQHVILLHFQDFISH